METIKRPIQNLLPDYIKYKKSLGYKYDNISHFYKIEKILAKYNIYFSLNLSIFSPLCKIKNGK